MTDSTLQFSRKVTIRRGDEIKFTDTETIDVPVHAYEDDILEMMKTAAGRSDMLNLFTEESRFWVKIFIPHYVNEYASKWQLFYHKTLPLFNHIGELNINGCVPKTLVHEIQEALINAEAFATHMPRSIWDVLFMRPRPTPKILIGCKNGDHDNLNFSWKTFEFETFTLRVDVDHSLINKKRMRYCTKITTNTMSGVHELFDSDVEVCGTGLLTIDLTLQFFYSCIANEFKKLQTDAKNEYIQNLAVCAFGEGTAYQWLISQPMREFLSEEYDTPLVATVEVEHRAHDGTVSSYSDEYTIGGDSEISVSAY